MYGRLEPLRSSDDLQGEARSMILCQLLSTRRQTLRKFVLKGRPPTKIANAVPCFAQDVIGAVEHLFHHLSEGISYRDVLGHALHPQCNALEPLQQRVMQFSR